ncbi:MAG TPA: hypothetical protein DIV79_05145 [Opitutae bacterium]|nr:hypothetical protein [Opitutae bacterium]
MDPSLPNGLEIRVKDGNGSPLEFVSRSGMSANIGDYSKASVGHVEIEYTNSLLIEITGDFEERVLSFSPGIFDSMGKWFLIGIPSAMVLSVAGVILLVVGLVDYSKSRKETKDQERGIS